MSGSVFYVASCAVTTVFEQRRSEFTSLRVFYLIGIEKSLGSGRIDAVSPREKDSGL